jgi:folate-dependent tRNA-U54 methylase TrmFO/GidA
MWDSLSSDQKLLYICNAAGAKASSDRIDMDLIYLAEQYLSAPQRERYVDYVSGEVSAQTYHGLTDDQIQATETTQRYYFNLIHVSAEMKAKCLWHAREDRPL